LAEDAGAQSLVVDGEADGAIELRMMGSYDRLAIRYDRLAVGSKVSTVAALRSLASISRWGSDREIC